jgi:hypothetical protein
MVKLTNNFEWTTYWNDLQLLRIPQETLTMTVSSNAGAAQNLDVF